MRPTIIVFYCPLYCATLPYDICAANIAWHKCTYKVRFSVWHAVWATVVNGCIKFGVGGGIWLSHIGGNAAEHMSFETWWTLVRLIILGVLLCTYQHLLCCLSMALAGLLSQFLVSGSSICIGIVHPINAASVHTKDVGTRQKKMQVNYQNIHCLAPAMSQASSILRAAKEFARVL